MAGAAPARPAPDRTAPNTASGLANRSLGRDARRPRHLWFSHRTGLVHLHRAILRRAIPQLSRRARVAEPDTRAVALVPSHSRHLETSLGRFHCRGRDRLPRLAAGETRALGEKFPAMAASCPLITGPLCA